MMNPSNSNTEGEALDRATARRLARLRTMPVELDGIRRAVEAEVGPPPGVAVRRRASWPGWLSPMRAAAASLLLSGLVAAVVISASSGPALASADRLAQIHADVQQHGGSHACQVDSIAAANVALARTAPGTPALPDVPAEHVHFCCVQNLGRKPVACAAVVIDGERVTLAVADAKDVRVTGQSPRVVAGRAYYVQSRGELNMVMTDQGGRWICVMGRLPADRLIETAGAVRP